MVDGMETYISRIADGVYRLELESGPVDIQVPDADDQIGLDYFTKELCIIGAIWKRKVNLVESFSYGDLWVLFKIAKNLRKYNESAANEWCIRVLGGISSIRDLIKKALKSINCQDYGYASDLLKEVEHLSQTIDTYSVVVFDVYESKEEMVRRLGLDEE